MQSNDHRHEHLVTGEPGQTHYPGERQIGTAADAVKYHRQPVRCREIPALQNQARIDGIQISVLKKSSGAEHVVRHVIVAVAEPIESVQQQRVAHQQSCSESYGEERCDVTPRYWKSK